MSKILCDNKNIVRFYFEDNDILTQVGEILITPYQNIGWPPGDGRVIYEDVTLPADIATSQYFYDGGVWTKNLSWTE